MKTSHIAIIVLVAFIVGFVFGMTVQRKYRPCTEVSVVTVRDTVIRVDTLKLPVPQAKDVKQVRHDTVKIKLTPIGNDSTRVDTIDQTTENEQSGGVQMDNKGNLTIPIESKTYTTEKYKAVVQGWRPELVSMEVYPKTITVNSTTTKTVVKKPWAAVTVGPGASWDGGKIAPSINVGIGFVIWSK